MLEEGVCYDQWVLFAKLFWQYVVHWKREWQATSGFLPWEPHEQYEKAKYMTPKDEFPRSVGAEYTTGEETPGRMKRQSQSENNTQLWMWLVMKVKSDAVKNNIA